MDALPGSVGTQIKTSLYVDDVFCFDPRSVRRLISIGNQFEFALGARVNCSKSEAMLFTNWHDRSSIPFTISSDYLKVVRIWFGEAKACNKNWLDQRANVKQALCLRKQCYLSITWKNVVISCEVL